MLKMSGWLSSPKQLMLEYGRVDEIPLVVVNGNVPKEALQLMARQDENIAAEALVIRDNTSHPTAVLHFGVTCGFTEKQLKIIAHEVCHLVANLLKLERDPTHDTDGGVL